MRSVSRHQWAAGNTVAVHAAPKKSTSDINRPSVSLPDGSCTGRATGRCEIRTALAICSSPSGVRTLPASSVGLLRIPSLARAAGALATALFRRRLACASQFWVPTAMRQSHAPPFSAAKGVPLSCLKARSKACGGARPANQRNLAPQRLVYACKCSPKPMRSSETYKGFCRIGHVARYHMLLTCATNPVVAMRCVRLHGAAIHVWACISASIARAVLRRPFRRSEGVSSTPLSGGWQSHKTAMAGSLNKSTKGVVLPVHPERSQQQFSGPRQTYP